LYPTQEPIQPNSFSPRRRREQDFVAFFIRHAARNHAEGREDDCLDCLLSAAQYLLWAGHVATWANDPAEQHLDPDGKPMPTWLRRFFEEEPEGDR